MGSVHYVMSMDAANITKQSKSYLGKLRAGASGAKYNLFGPGESPSKKLSPEMTRNQFGAVCYVSCEVKYRKQVPIEGHATSECYCQK